MADAPVPIGQPGHVPPSGPAEGPDQTKTTPAAKAPAEVPPPIDATTLKAIFDALQTTITGLGTTMEKVSKTIKQADGAVGSFNKRINKGSQEVLFDINLIDESAAGLADKFKAQYEFQKKWAREMATGGVKSSKQAADLLKTLKAQHELLLKQRGVSKEQTANTKTQLANVTAMLEALEKAGDTPLDTKQFAEMATLMGQTAKSGADLANSMKNAKLTHLEKDVKGVHDSIMNLFGKSDSKLGKRLDALRTIGTKGTAIREARAQRNIARGKEHGSENVGVIRAKLKELGIDSSDRAGVEGVARKHGFGYLGAKAFARKEAEGDSAGAITNFGDRLLTKGKGSMLRGVLGEAAEAGEGIAAGAAEVAGGSLALPLAAVGALIAGFAENNKLNSDIDKKLGRGGIYSGGNDPITAISNIKANLNSGGMYNPMGIGYDKNLEIANALSEAGFSSKNLSESIVGTDKEGKGFMRGSFGSMQKDVYSYGRMAGLDSSTTMAQTIKMITQYKMSLVATEDFFVQINRDAASANITTTQYISLIDEVNSQYERSNKLLLATTDIMRLLGSTGLHTAEDLKENLGVITNNGKERTVEQMTMLLTQTLGAQGGAGSLAGFYGKNNDRQIQGVVDSLAFGNEKDKEGKLIPLTKDGTTYDADTVRKMLNDSRGSSDLENLIQHAFPKDSTAGKTAYGAFQNAQKSNAKQIAVDAAADVSTGSAAERGFRLANFIHGTGHDIMDDQALTLSAGKFLMKTGNQGKGYSVADISNPLMMNRIKSDAAVMGISGALGGDKDPLGKLQPILHDAAFALTEEAKRGMDGLDPTKGEGAHRKARLEQMAGELGVTAAPGQSLVDALQAFENIQKNQDKSVTDLTMKQSTYDDAMGVNSITSGGMSTREKEEAKRAADRNAANLVGETRSPEEILEAFLKFWLVKVVDTLSFIAKLLGGTSTVGAGAPGGENDQKLLDSINEQIAKFPKDTEDNPLSNDQKDKLAKLQGESGFLQKVVSGGADLSKDAVKKQLDDYRQGAPGATKDGTTSDGHRIVDGHVIQSGMDVEDLRDQRREAIKAVAFAKLKSWFGGGDPDSANKPIPGFGGLGSEDPLSGLGGSGAPGAVDGKDACCVTNNYYTTNNYNSVAAMTLPGEVSHKVNNARETAHGAKVPGAGVKQHGVASGSW